jgi:hypothetical protein
MPEIHRIIDAKVVQAHVIELRFGDGYTARLDFAPALWGPIFEPLKDPEYFRRFRLEDDTIRWPNDADFCPDVLRFWCESARVKSQQDTDSYFAAQLASRAAS